MANDNSLRRRTVLRRLGTGSAFGLAGVPLTVSASNESALIGVSYDTFSQQPGSKVHGQVSGLEPNIQGTLEIAGFTIPLDKLEPISRNDESSSSYIGILDDEQYLEDEIPLKVKIDVLDTSISGRLSRPSSKFGDLGFYLLNESDIEVDEELTQMAANKKFGANAPTFEVPQRGLPTDSGSSRLVELARQSGLPDERVRSVYSKGDKNDSSVEADTHSELTTMSSDIDSGVLVEDSYSDYKEGNCESMSWTLKMGAIAEDDVYHEYDEIGFNQSNKWSFYAFFTDRPDGVFHCDPDHYVYPDNYNVHVEPWNDDHRNSIYFSHPEPDDGDGESDNNELNLLFDIIAGASGSRLVSVGSSLVKYVMAGSGNSTIVSYEDGGAEYLFDIDLSGGYDDLPHESSNNAEVTQVSLRTHNEMLPNDSPHLVAYLPKYTFRYSETTACSCFSATPYSKYETIAPQCPMTIYYDSVDVN